MGVKWNWSQWESRKNEKESIGKRVKWNGNQNSRGFIKGKGNQERKEKESRGMGIKQNGIKGEQKSKGLEVKGNRSKKVNKEKNGRQEKFGSRGLRDEW